MLIDLSFVVTRIDQNHRRNANDRQGFCSRGGMQIVDTWHSINALHIPNDSTSRNGEGLSSLAKPNSVALVEWVEIHGEPI
jgi:hypothetical protein